MTHTQYNFNTGVKEDMVHVYGFGYIPSSELRPSERHQIMEDTIKFQKEFASEIYVQRCREKDL